MKVVKIVLIVLAVVICTPLAILYGGFRASLPQLDGSAAARVSAPVSITRDSLGTPGPYEDAGRLGLVGGACRRADAALPPRAARGENAVRHAFLLPFPC